MYIVIFWGAMIKSGKEGETDVIVAQPLHNTKLENCKQQNCEWIHSIRSMDVMELWQHSVGS